MKRFLFALMCTLPLFAGCGTNDSSSADATTKTTLYGTLQPPAVTAQMVGPSKRAAVRSVVSNVDLLDGFVSKGTCMVNGKEVAFSLDTGNSTFRVDGLEPFGAYEVRFDLASLSLRATRPYAGIQMNMGKVNMTSTVKSLLYAAYGGGDAKVKDIRNYEILDEKAGPIAARLEELLSDEDITPEAFGENLENAISTFISQNHLNEISNFIGNDMSGTWKGQGMLYTKTNTDEVGQKASVNLTLYTQREKNTLTGWVNVEIAATENVNNGGIIPISGKRMFTARVATEGEFSFEVCNSSQTPVERWSFTLDSTTGTLGCTVKSLHEQGYFSVGKGLSLHQ